MAEVDLSLLIAASAICLGILIFGFAGGRFCRTDHLPPRSEIRRHMLCGLYCNPEDPRTIVHRPYGTGWTLNVRRETCAQLLIVMATVAILAAVVYLLLSFGPKGEAVQFIAQ
jgi:uncharacterized membrane protein